MIGDGFDQLVTVNEDEVDAADEFFDDDMDPDGDGIEDDDWEDEASEEEFEASQEEDDDDLFFDDWEDEEEDD